MAIDHGADAIGLVGHMPSGPGVIDDELIAEIAASVVGVDTFLLTSETDAEQIVAHHQKVRTTAIQIVDQLTSGTHREIKNELPDVTVVQVVHVVDESSVEEALLASETADVVLLDSGNANLEVKELGGTGRTHNWGLSRKIVEACAKPVFLAGGLSPDNVAGAVVSVNPFGVDLCSGVRTDGVLDERKLVAFVGAIGIRRLGKEQGI